MFWFGIAGRKKIGALEASLGALEERFEKLHQDFRTLDLEMTDHLDKLAGIAKRFTGRKGGRPPNPPADVNENADGDSERPVQHGLGFSRHVL